MPGGATGGAGARGLPRKRGPRRAPTQEPAPHAEGRTMSRVETGKTRIGWIGTGVMGRSMCGHILDRGYPVVLFSRTRAKAEPLLARGAAWADSPRAVA